MMVTCAIFFGCGGKVATEDVGGVPSVFGPPSADAVPYDARLGPLLDVSGGSAVVGSWAFNESSKALSYRCDRGLPGVRLEVAPFRMMKTEVSNAAYAGCVKSGACLPPDSSPAGAPLPLAWDSEEKTSNPVAATFALARHFCRHYGGDLPTSAQWSRAAAGDESGFGVPDLTALYLRCHQGSTEALCDALVHSGFAQTSGTPSDAGRDSGLYRPLPNVGTTPWDVGPFGHLDLFASATEWVLFDREPIPCVDGAADSVDQDALTSAHAFPTRSVVWSLDVWLGQQIFDVNGDEAVPVEVDVHADHAWYYDGFRCAFPATAGP